MCDQRVPLPHVPLPVCPSPWTGNQLTSADGLQGLSRLTELVLDHNKIRVG